MSNYHGPVVKKEIVALGERSYTIFIGDGLIDRVHSLLPGMAATRYVVVTNPAVGEHYLDRLISGLAPSRLVIDRITVPDGEAYKTGDTLYGIHTRLLELNADRRTVLIALGGGVVGDLAGFAAATYQRGIDFVQVPTTLLSQVDSSVGGKTGINHPLGKNMIGAFHQPKAVIVDIATLSTLPRRELAAGLAEVIKYGLIRDAAFFAWLEQNIDALVDSDSAALEYAIAQSCRYKADIVAADERESGVRALLNFGHTFGHAIETGVGYGEWLHGEAVAAGMVLAARLSARLGWIVERDLTRIEMLIKRARLPIEAPALGRDTYLQLMTHDKKTIDQQLHLILLRAIGNAVVTSDVTTIDLDAILPA